MINFPTTILEMGKPELILVIRLEPLTFIPTFNSTLPCPHFCIVRTHVIPKLKVLGIYLRAISRRWLPFSLNYKSIVFIMMRLHNVVFIHQYHINRIHTIWLVWFSNRR